MLSQEVRMQFLLIVMCVPVMVITYQESGIDLKISPVDDLESLDEIEDKAMEEEFLKRIKRAPRSGSRSGSRSVSRSARTAIRTVRNSRYSSTTRRNVVLIRRTYNSHNDETSVSEKLTCVKVIDTNVSNTAMNTSYTSKNISIYNYNNSSNNSVTRNSSTVKPIYVCTQKASGLRIESSYKVLIWSIVLVTVSLNVVYNFY